MVVLAIEYRTTVAVNLLQAPEVRNEKQKGRK
jgi:hypothetical protein